MATTGDSNDAYDRLQQDLVRQLDAIAGEIDAGRLTLEEGSARADVLIEQAQSRSAPLLTARVAQRQRTQSRSRMVVVAAVVLFVAYLAIKTWVLRFA